MVAGAASQAECYLCRESDGQPIDCGSFLRLWFLPRLLCFPAPSPVFVASTRTPLCGWPTSRFQPHSCPTLSENLPCPYCVFAVRSAGTQRNITLAVGTKWQLSASSFSIIMINKNDLRNLPVMNHRLHKFSLFRQSITYAWAFSPVRWAVWHNNNTFISFAFCVSVAPVLPSWLVAFAIFFLSSFLSLSFFFLWLSLSWRRCNDLSFCYFLASTFVSFYVTGSLF